MIQNPIVTIAQKYYTDMVRAKNPNMKEREFQELLNSTTLSTEDYNKFLVGRLSRQWYETDSELVYDKGLLDVSLNAMLKPLEILKDHAPRVYFQLVNTYDVSELEDAPDSTEYLLRDQKARCEGLVLLYPKELYGTRYRRCNSKVFEFINSLDMPDEELTKLYLMDLAERARLSPTGIYSEMYHLSTSGGKGTFRIISNAYGTIFCDYFHEKRIGKGNDLAFTLPGSVWRREGDGLKEFLHSFSNLDQYESIGFTHPLGFLVNLYLAEKTGSIVKAEETKEERREVERLASCGPKDKKPKEVCYEYVKVTDEAWTQYEVSERIRREGGPRGEYLHRKSFWWTKAYYRKQNYKNNTSKIILINGHYCHARTKVQELPIVEVLV